MALTISTTIEEKLLEIIYKLFVLPILKSLKFMMIKVQKTKNRTKRSNLIFAATKKPKI